MATFVDIISKFDPKGLIAADNGLNKSEGSFRKWGKAIAAIGVAATAAVGAFAVKFGTDAVKAASDFEEAFSATTQIFGDAAKAITDFATSSSADIGQTSTQVLAAAKDFGTFGLAAGLSGKDLSNFALNFVTLASDLASFNNTTPEQAIVAIGAALRGESEPIRNYGVLLNDATLKQKAFELGLISTTKEALTPQQKILAAQAAIYEQTGVAQGDFARTSDGLANSQRILSAEFENFKIELGQKLLPVVLTVVNYFKDNLLPIIEKFVGVIGEYLEPIVAAATKAFEDFTKGGDGLIKNGFLQKVLDVGTKLFKTIRDDIIPIIKKWITDAWDKIQPKVKEFFDVFKKDLLPAIEDFIPVASKIVKYIIDTMAPVITGIVTTVIDVAKGFIKAISGIIDFLTGIFKGDWEKAFNGLKDIVFGIFEAIKGLIAGAVGLFWSSIESKLTAFKDKWTEAFNKYRDIVSERLDSVKDFFKNLPAKLLELIKDLPAKFLEVGKNIIDGLWNGIKQKWEDLKKGVSDVFNGVVDWAKGILGISSPSRVFIEIGKDTIEGFNEGIRNSDIRTAMGEQIDKLRDVAKSKLEEVKDAFASFRDDIRQKIIDGIDFNAAFSDWENDKANAKEKGEEYGGSFIEKLQEQADKSKEFAKKIRELTKLGLSKDAIKEVLEAGVDAGTKIADELIKGGSDTIRKTNELVKATKDAADEISKQVASTFYGAGIVQAKNLVLGFKNIFDRNGNDWKKLKQFLKEVAEDLGMNVEFKVKASNPTGTKTLSLPDGTTTGTSSTMSSSSAGTVINVNVSGALDPEAVARQIETILKRSTLRAGNYA